MKEHKEKYDIGDWERIECRYNIRLFDKIKIKTRNLTTICEPKRTIVASNGRYE